MNARRSLALVEDESLVKQVGFKQDKLSAHGATTSAVSSVKHESILPPRRLLIRTKSDFPPESCGQRDTALACYLDMLPEPRRVLGPRL